MSEPQKNFQLKLSSQEMTRLANQVMQDCRAAIADHQQRIQRWDWYYRRWRTMPDMPETGDEEKSNFRVPLIRWNTLARWAKEIDSIFGDDAEIVAVPTGPSDFRKVKKIGRYMTWLVLSSMKLTRPLMEFTLRKILFGRSVAYAPWKRETFDANGKEVVDFEGPDFVPLWPDDFIVPAEDVRSLHEFSWVCRRYRVTPDELLQGEEEQRYQGIKKNFAQIVNAAERGLRREFEGEEIKQSADEAEGMSFQRPLSSGESLMVLEWYGKWRMLKPGKDDGGEYDFDAREMRESEIVVRFIPELNMVVSVQDLADLYPGMRRRRPFVESAMLPEGRYWSMGMCELILDAEDELSANHNLATDGQQLAVAPPIAVRPGSGMDDGRERYQPGEKIQTDNPSQDFKQMEIAMNIEAVQWKEQTILAYVERTTGQSDPSLGRQSDRPNAPRTAHGQAMLLQEGNVQVSLYTKILAEDMGDMLRHFWELEYWFAPEEQFFRVSEDDADGLFEVKDGGSMLTKEDRDGRFDFQLKFANSIYSREANKERTLARYQLDIQNPLIMNNPVALWHVTNDAHEALGDPNFSQLVPMPPEGDISIDPKEEWNRLLQGEEIHVNPQDNDELHLMRHRRDLTDAEKDPEKDDDAFKKLIVHYMQHVEQLQQKKVVQALAEQAAGAIQQLGAAGALPPGALQAFQTFPGQGMPPGNPQAQTPAVFPGQK